jgi:hypothetical protein
MSSREVGRQRAPLRGARLWDLPPRACLLDPPSSCSLRATVALPKPTAPRATAIATGPRVCGRCLPALGSSPSLDTGGAPPLASPRKPPPPLARPREPSPPLKPNPWRSGVFYSRLNLVRLNWKTPLSQGFL